MRSFCLSLPNQSYPGLCFLGPDRLCPSLKLIPLIYIPIMSFLLALAILVFSWMYLQYFRPQPQSRTKKSGTLNSTPPEEGIVTRHDVRVDSNSTTEKSGVVEKPTHSHPSALAGNIDVESSSEELEEISPESISIAIFCALAYEAVAVKLILDEEYSCHLKGTGPKKYVYSFGRIAKHRIVIARPHQMGTVEAAHCATAVSQQFPNVRFALMVGIGAGIPNYPKHDIRLGDIAVSIPQDSHPGVIQYDFGKYERDRFILKGCLNKPPPILISADESLVEDELMGRSPLARILRKITQVQRFARPNTDDILFDEHFHHVSSGSDCSGCEESSERKVVSRPERQSQQPVVHRGLILSGNGVVKNPSDRDILRRDNEDAICFERGAAGIMDEIPCLIVRGICDYADTHENDSWHYYAAAGAAAYCKALLRKVDSQDVETRSMSELFEGIKSLRKGVSDLRDAQRYTVHRFR